MILVKGIEVLLNVSLQYEDLKSKVYKFSRQLPSFLCSFIYKRTINNNNMNLLMVLHHNHADFLDVPGVTLIPGTLPTLNLSIKSHLSSG